MQGNTRSVLCEYGRKMTNIRSDVSSMNDSKELVC